MPLTSKPEILSPRTKRTGKMFDDEHLDILSHILDDFIKIPGTPIRFGLDGIVGFIPGIGDFIGGIASCIIILAAWARGVSYVTISRMVANVGIEVLVGSVPVLGDFFDIAWRANRRNYALLTGSMEEPEKHRKRSWLFFIVLCAVLLVLLVLPVLLFTWISVHVLQGIFGFDVHTAAPHWI